MEKDPNDPRVFPMSYWNTRVIWQVMLMKAGIVEVERYKNKWSGKQSKKVKRGHKGERLLQHPHCLRKFFRSYLGDADFSEYLMGHATVMTRTYRQMKKEDMAAKYLKLMPNVTIFEHTPDLSGIQDELVKKDIEIRKLKTDMAAMENVIEATVKRFLDAEKKKKI